MSIENRSKDGAYVFISYVSPDRDKVNAALEVLYRRGFRFWYDQFIDAGATWENDIMQNIENSKAFLGFISHDFGTRRVAREEIRRALDKREKDETYKVVLVLLDIGALTAFDDETRAKIKKTQYIRYWKEGGIVGGLTESFVNKLTGANWPPEVIDEKRRRDNGFTEPWKPGGVQEDELQRLLDEADKLPWRSHHRLIDDYKPRTELVRVGAEEKELRFYPLSDAQLEPTAVYPIIMDNQWVPRAVYDDPELRAQFFKDGLKCPAVAEVIKCEQRKEIFRALLHNWQIIVNRASILNSEIFSDWYTPGNAEYDAFRDMMGDDSIVTYLWREERPTDRLKFGVSPEGKNWLNFCLNAPEKKEISCLRLDWDSKKSNVYETARLLTYRFQNFCLVTAQDEYRMNALMAALGIPNENGEAFRKLWGDIQEAVIKWNAETGENYSREAFYKQFIVLDESPVPECRLDTAKPFAWELKQIIDFVYTTNLPDALNMTPVIPPDSPMTAFHYSERSQIQGQREISPEELAFAAEEFTRSVRAAMKAPPPEEQEDKSKEPRHYCTAPMPFPARTNFTLGQLCQIRASKKWIRYVRKLTDGKTRARLNELDFHNIPGVWESYWQFLRWMEEQKDKIFPGLEWRTVPAALSVLYHFEETTLAAVYDRKADGTPRLRMCFPDMDKLTECESLRRKTALWIDYVCSDVIAEPENPWMNNLLLTEVRLFEGMTRVNGIDVFKKLRCALCEAGFERAPIPDFVGT